MDCIWYLEYRMKKRRSFSTFVSHFGRQVFWGMRTKKKNHYPKPLLLLATTYGNWLMHISSAKSHDCHNGCSWVGGKAGWDTGVQSSDFMIRSARRKLRNKLATSKSCLKSFWNKSESSTFHAIVSVIAVNIQLSSPSIVRLSVTWPGIFSSRSMVRPGMSWHEFFWDTYQWRAARIGVVKHAVNRSRGKLGCMGKSSLRPHAAKWIESRMRGICSACWFCFMLLLFNKPLLLVILLLLAVMLLLTLELTIDVSLRCKYSFSLSSSNWRNVCMMRPAFEQSHTYKDGEPIHVWTSYKERGMYWVNSLLNTHISPLAVGFGTPCPL